MSIFTIAKKLKHLRRLVNHYRLEHKGLSYRQAKFEVLDDLFDSLPDGAYFAAMEEQGYETEDIIECSEARK